MKNKLIALFIILFSILSTNIYAKEPIIRNIEKGEEAPFDGVILNYLAADEVLNKHTKIIEECKINLEEQKELMEEECKHKINFCDIELKTEIEKNDQLMQIKDEHILYLEEMATNDDDWTELYFVGGFIGGAIVASVIVIAIN